ncbi:DUF1853 family protein [Neisseria chenwenguii]|uniref:DUF1853 family protein n=1 Tax=Neisseria chenwenguii TaxID=1853278 RepID=UPI000F4E2262|nr:DUF1853 family protein [Neisseria chenwenguii]ROV57232.1 DUF1853 family protein [Neisseria chenwenguii]
MNYALDALWWKLTARPVRDLAALLTAPPLWASGCELGVRQLLGERGFRYLLDLDADPQPLADYLAEHAPFAHRLGLYAEHLLAFWFNHAPHAELYAHNLPVVSDGLTLGAADFVASLNGKLYHIELACKYYGSANGRLDDMCGLNRSDRMADKGAKLPQQLMLLKLSDGLKTLKNNGLQFDDLQPASIVRGIGFFPPNTAPEPPLNPHGWHGLYLTDWREYPFDNPNARFYKIGRMDYLAPARVSETETLTTDAVTQISDGLIAVLEHRPDGFWHEVLRIMKTEAV